MAYDIQNHQEDKVNKVVLVKRGEHSEETSSAETIRYHIQQATKERGLIQFACSYAIQGIQGIAEAVQVEEVPESLLIKCKVKGTETSYDTKIADQIRHK